MSWWKRFREFDRKGLLIDKVVGSKAYTKMGYVFDRRIFRVYFFLIVVPMILWVMWSSGVGWREFYVSCPISGYGQCENPFYLNCDMKGCESIKYMEFLPRGFEMGNKPTAEFERTMRNLRIS